MFTIPSKHCVVCETTIVAGYTLLQYIRIKALYTYTENENGTPTLSVIVLRTYPNTYDAITHALPWNKIKDPLPSLGTGCVSQNWYCLRRASSSDLGAPWGIFNSSMAFCSCCSLSMGTCRTPRIDSTDSFRTVFSR